MHNNNNDHKHNSQECCNKCNSCGDKCRCESKENKHCGCDAKSGEKCRQCESKSHDQRRDQSSDLEGDRANDCRETDCRRNDCRHNESKHTHHDKSDHRNDKNRR